MRKILSCIMVLMLLSNGLAVCSASPLFPSMVGSPQATEAPAANDDTLIRAALRTLESAWRKEYNTANHYSAGEHLVDIRGTRLIRIKDSLEEREEKYFGDISCVIEFLMYDDYYGMDGSGHNVGYYDVSQQLCYVVVHRNGIYEAVKMSPFRLYSSRTYIQDFSSFVEEVIDYRDLFNQVFTFTVR